MDVLRLQETLYVWNEPKLCTKGVPLPARSFSPCEAIGLWLKIGVGGGAFMAVLLISLTCYFWKKNKRSEPQMWPRWPLWSLFIVAKVSAGVSQCFVLAVANYSSSSTRRFLLLISLNTFTLVVPCTCILLGPDSIPVVCGQAGVQVLSPGDVSQQGV